MNELAEALLRQPLRTVAELTATDIPVQPGIYAWHRSGRLFYIGESHRGLRSRLWENHLRGNARGSTLRNKVAKTFGFEPVGFRKYGRDAEAAITAKLLECEIRLVAVNREEISAAQDDLIARLDPPMNDHPGEQPRWRLDEVREILDIDAATKVIPAREVSPKPGTPPSPPFDEPPRWNLVDRKLAELARSQAWFPTTTGKPNRIVAYDAGRRVLVETETGTNWVQLSWIITHWQTLTALGEIAPADVLRPGRRSAFMFALFRQLPGVDELPGRPARIRISASHKRRGSVA